jgi:hypothetical protein
MPLIPYKPFPYSGSQAIIVSDRVWIHSKNDSTMIFGSDSIGLSSKGTINLDSSIYTVVFSPKIYLGRGSENETEPVILGQTFIDALDKFCNKVSTAAMLAKSGPDSTKLITFFDELTTATSRLQETLGSSLSKTTFVK